jgi:hypothetical protein
MALPSDVRRALPFRSRGLALGLCPFWASPGVGLTSSSVGQSRHRTSGGTAVSINFCFLARTSLQGVTSKNPTPPTLLIPVQIRNGFIG